MKRSWCGCDDDWAVGASDRNLRSLRPSGYEGPTPPLPPMCEISKRATGRSRSSTLDDRWLLRVRYRALTLDGAMWSTAPTTRCAARHPSLHLGVRPSSHVLFPPASVGADLGRPTAAATSHTSRSLVGYPSPTCRRAPTPRPVRKLHRNRDPSADLACPARRVGRLSGVG